MKNMQKTLPQSIDDLQAMIDGQVQRNWGHISPLAKFDNKEIIGTGASLLLTTFKIFYDNRICQAILQRGGLTIRIKNQM